MGGWNLLLFIIIAILFAPYMFLPLLVRSRQWFSTNPQVVPASETELPQTARDYFQEVTQQLESLGFTNVLDVRIFDFAPDQISYARLFAHKKNHDNALAVDMSQSAPNVETLHMNFMEFNTEFSDGRELSIANTAILHQPGMCRNKILIHIPNQNNLIPLYKLHRDLKLYYGKGDPGKSLPEDNLLSEIRNSLVTDMQCTVESGYFYVDSQTSRFVPTFKGAYLTSWTHMWPFRAIRMAKAKRKARQLMKLTT